MSHSKVSESPSSAKMIELLDAAYAFTANLLVKGGTEEDEASGAARGSTRAMPMPRASRRQAARAKGLKGRRLGMADRCGVRAVRSGTLSARWVGAVSSARFSTLSGRWAGAVCLFIRAP